ncbi:MAG: class I SAM-dependent methyltransferase, partial [Rhabdochlamydiaceae bacterium]
VRLINEQKANEILEIGPSKFPNPKATVRIDIVPNPFADYVMNAERMVFPNDSFEEVLMFECLEHTENPLQVLREIQRVLRPKGKLVLSVPNVYYYRKFLRWFFKGELSASYEHIWNWSFFELKQLLARTGLQVEKYEMITEEWNNKRSFWDFALRRVTCHSLMIQARKP